MLTHEELNQLKPGDLLVYMLPAGSVLVAFGGRCNGSGVMVEILISANRGRAWRGNLFMPTADDLLTMGRDDSTTVGQRVPGWHLHPRTRRPTLVGGLPR